jgi:3',5'-cyclic AMP phosphodiesterase CpdA
MPDASSPGGASVPAHAGPPSAATPAPGARPAPRSPRRFRLELSLVAALIAAGVMLGLAFLAPASAPGAGGRPRPDTALRIAHITDPHLFEEPGKRTWGPDELEDRDAFADALEYLRADSAAHGRAANALVVTGDWGIDPSFMDAGKRGPDQQLSLQREADVVANLLRRSPVKQVFTVLGNNDLKGELSDRANLERFDAFFDSVSARLKGSGVSVRNLTACYGSQADSTCTADVRTVRLVGFASGSFKNGPSDAPPAAPAAGVTAGATGTVPAAAATAQNASSRCRDSDLQKLDAEQRGSRAALRAVDDRAIATRFARLVADGARSGRRILVLTHEPDVDDPYFATVVRACRDEKRVAESRALQAAIWNVDPAVRKAWQGAVGTPSVLAVLSGHLHSYAREDYRPRWAADFASTASPPRLYISPPLAVKNQNNQTERPEQARGLSMYRFAGGDLEREVVWMSPSTGFADARRALEPRDTPGSAEARAAWTDVTTVLLIALGAAFAGVMMAFAGGLRRWRIGTTAPRNGLWWLEHLSFLPILASALGGLALALLLVSPTWDDRRQVALPYVLAFLACALVTGMVLRSIQRQNE